MTSTAGILAEPDESVQYSRYESATNECVAAKMQGRNPLADTIDSALQTQSGIGVDVAERKHKRQLERQRQRREQRRRIDYYPSTEALGIINARTFGSVGGDYSSIINKLVLAAAQKQVLK